MKNKKSKWITTSIIVFSILVLLVPIAYTYSNTPNKTQDNAESTVYSENYTNISNDYSHPDVTITSNTSDSESDSYDKDTKDTLVETSENYSALSTEEIIEIFRMRNLQFQRSLPGNIDFTRRRNLQFDRLDPGNIDVRRRNNLHFTELLPLEMLDPSPLRIHPSIDYNSFNNNLKISLHAYDVKKGEEVTDGTVTYIVKDSSDEILTSGNLNYENYLWNDEKNISLSYGSYKVKFNINGYRESTVFKVGSGDVKIYGDLKNENDEKLENVSVTLYNSLEFPYKILESKKFNKNYSFEITLGSYIIVAEDEEDVFTTPSFSVFGGQEIKKDLILSDKEGEIKSLLNEIKNSLVQRTDEETEKMSLLTDFASEDLEPKTDLIEEVGDFTLIGNFILGSIFSDGKVSIDGPLQKVIELALKYKNDKGSYEKLLEVETNITRKNFLLNEDSEKMLETLSWLTNSSNEYQYRTKQELKTQEFYQNSLNLIEEIHDSGSFSVNDSVDFSKLRRIVNDQLNQFRERNTSSNLLILPNPEEELIYWGLDDHYDNYLYHKEEIEFAEKGGEISGYVSKSAFYIGVGAGVVGGITAGVVTLWTGPGAAAAGIATGVVVTKKVSVFISKVADYTEFAFEVMEINIHASMVQEFIFASSEWILSVARTPDMYGSTTSFIEEETNNPYYLHKNNEFDSNLKININPDKIENEKNYFFREKGSRIIRNASINLENLLNKSLTRVLAESKIEHKTLVQQLGYDYFSKNLSENQEIQKNMTLSGLWNSELSMKPQIFIVEAFSGPFQTSIEKEHFYVIKKRLWERLKDTIGFNSMSESLSEEEEWEMVKSSEMPIRSQEKQLTVEDYIDYLPEISDIYSETKEIRTFSLETQDEEFIEELSLSRNNPEFVFNYTVGNNYGAEFQLFYPTGTDVDLYIYSNDSYIGHNPETNDKHIGFPGVYSGKHERPEIIYIPQATNKTYTVKAKLVKEDSNLTTPIKISALETPFRPALLSIWTFVDNRTIFLNENVTLDFLISEIGEQKPIENVSIEFEIEGMNNISELKYEIDKINAGESIQTNFELEPETTGNFEGVLNVNSSAGELNYSVALNFETIMGDVTMNCKVGISDLANVGSTYNSIKGEEGWNPNADLNNDGKIDIFDLAIVGLNYGNEC